MSLRIKQIFRRISRDHGSSGSQSNLVTSGASSEKTKKGGPFSTKDILPTVKEEKKNKKASKKSSAPPALVNTEDLCVERTFKMDNQVKRKYSEPDPQVPDVEEGEETEPKLKRDVSDLIRSSETKTQEIAALKIEIGRLKETLCDKQHANNANDNTQCAADRDQPENSGNLETLVKSLNSENLQLRKHLQKFGVSLDASPICDQQKELILSRVSAISNSGAGLDGSNQEKEWDAKSHSSISELSVACLQGRIQQMEETHCSTNEELQATIQELEDLKEHSTECQLELQQLQEEKHVILESLAQQTEKLTEARGYNDSLKLMLIQQSENNQEISQCERSQRLMELLKNVQEDRELHQMKQEELDRQISASKEAEDRFHMESQLIRDRMKLLESMVEDANTEKRCCESQLQQSLEDLKAAKQDIDRLESSLASAKEKIAELEVAVTSGEKSELADILERVSHEKETIENKLSQMQKELNTQTFENEKLKVQLTGLQNDFKTSQNAAKTSLNDIEWQRNQLERKRRDLEHEVETLRTSILDLQGTCQRHLEDKRELKANLCEAQKKLSEVIEQREDAERMFSEERTLFNKQVEEWDQFQTDLLTTVRVANDFKTEAQHDLEKLQQENQFLKDRLKTLDSDLERAKASSKMASTVSSLNNSTSLNDRRLLRSMSHVAGESFLTERRGHHRPLARGDSRVKSLIESIECATKQTRAGSRSSSTSSLASAGSDSKPTPVLKRADTDSIIRNLPSAMKESTNSPLRTLNCNINDSSYSKSNLPDTVKMSQLSNDQKSNKYNGSYTNSSPTELSKNSILSTKIDSITRNPYCSTISDKKDPLATLAQRGDTKRNALLKWCQNKTLNYAHVDITNFSTSWSDGLALCAILNSYLPEKIDYSSLNPADIKNNFDVAFSAAESVGILTTLDANDMIHSERPNWQAVFNYVTSIFCHFET